MSALVKFIESGIEGPSASILKRVDEYLDGGCDRDELEKTVRLNIVKSGLEGLSQGGKVREALEGDAK